MLFQLLANLLRGKKAQFAAQQTPQQQSLVNYLTGLSKGNIGQGSANKQPTYDALNMISKMFGVGGGQYGMPQQNAQPGAQQSSTNPLFGIMSQLFRNNPQQRV
jgi:hypothetical protein